MKEHLVAYEYGTGTAWGYVVANSAADIVEAMPELDVIEQAPSWLTTEDLGAVQEYCTYTLEESSVDAILEGKKAIAIAIAS
ncbi:MAG: hypothetical protein QNJ88_04280 [Acidimicrobiia bacterium]|nr:hypothetical protein [Acidimicrobiia bacterium]